MKRKIKMSLFILLVLLIICLFNNSYAYTEQPELNEKFFYIKNAYTGQYLDVEGGVSQAGTNIQQYEYNGSSAQKWYVHHLGNGEYMLLSGIDHFVDNQGINNFSYALDIDNGYNTNGAQIHIWSAVIGGTTQTVGFVRKPDGTYVIQTKCSNYTKVVSLSNNVCTNGVNIHQWEYSNHSHDHWIMEPVEESTAVSKSYALSAYQYHLDAFPNLSSFAYVIGLDSMNFSSQCILSSGHIHQSSIWFMKRTDTVNSIIQDFNQLSTSWDYEPEWYNIEDFKQTFNSRRIIYRTGQQILNNPGDVWNSAIQKGDVILKYSSLYFDNLYYEEPHMSYYIYDTDVDYYNGNSYMTYITAYHRETNNNNANISLLQLAEDYPNDIFLFMSFSNL